MANVSRHGSITPPARSSLIGRHGKRVCVALWAALVVAARPAAAQPSDAALTPPVTDGEWVRPAATAAPAVPEWGHADGLRVGIAPLPGPRGLLRVYAPYVGLDEPKVINFIAVEPIPMGSNGRGLSELERSRLDGKAGKRFWSAGTTPNEPGDPVRPDRGTVVEDHGVRTLTTCIGVERFDNGAHVYLRLRFRSDRPREVGIAVFAHDDSVPLRSCVVSATMGNFARLRLLELVDRTVDARELWPTFSGDGFAPHKTFPLASLKRTTDGDAVVAARSDEADTTLATYAPGTNPHWQYAAKPAVQRWRMPSPPAELVVGVNGRTAYWASQSPIPGGIAFENFELIAPFVPGQEFWFGVDLVDALHNGSANATQPAGSDQAGPAAAGR